MRSPVLVCLIALAAARIAAAADQAPLALEKKIPLGDVGGRIDHFAIDRAGQRLFLAELGNNTIGVIDLKAGAVARRLTGLRSPQGVGYAPDTGLLFVADGGDGVVHVYRGNDLSPVGVIDLKDDADNVRINPVTQDVVIGVGDGALAVLDSKGRERKAEVPLKDHPEGFQIDPSGRLAYVNVPDARQIAVVDLSAGRQIATWDKLPASSNFPMALMAEGKKLAVAFRSPSRLAIFDTANGAVLAQMPTCGDADDVFLDARRDRLYVACGEGKIDVFESASATPKLSAQIATASGARTAFFDPDGDRYYLAVRGGLTQKAEVWVYRAAD